MNPRKYPDGHVFYRRMGHPHPVAVKGEGGYIYDQEGKRYLDGSGGPLVVNVGHGVKEIVEAIATQAEQLAYVPPTGFTSQPVEMYAAALAEVTPLQEPKYYFMSSGSEAVETAIKFARQWQVDRGEPSRDTIISRWGSYHGGTLGALGATGKPKMRKLFEPMLPDFAHIEPPYCYRCPYGLEYPGCRIRCAEALEEKILDLGPEKVAAFIAEPISGATLGAVVPPQEYWPRLRQICDQYGVLLITDEIMTGMGRTGKWFAVEHWGVKPDIITLGKGTAGGYFPLSAMAVGGDLVDLIADRHGDFVHGGTFSHHVLAGAAGLATVNYIQKHDLVGAAARLGIALKDRLADAFEGLPCVGDIRGLGLMWGIEFVADKDSKEPFDPSFRFAQRVGDTAFGKGLFIYPGSGNVDGKLGDQVMVGPPAVITLAQLDELISILKESILDVWGSVR